MEWTLAAYGDGVEQALGKRVCRLFPNYEKFWALHVVPLTYRVMNQKCIFVRAKVRPALERMATANYAVFVHLAACHQQLKSRPEPGLFAAEGVYTFYSRLYSVEEAVFVEFLPAVETLAQYYSKRYIPPDCDANGKVKRKLLRYATRLERNGHRGLHHDVNAAFQRASLYRHQRVHRWGFPTQSGKVPGPKYVRAWAGKGLGELARADEKRLAREFVDALPQARKDLRSIEMVLNKIWEMALKELADFKYPYLATAYTKIQSPTKNERLPSWWRAKNPLSAEAVITSGSATLNT